MSDAAKLDRHWHILRISSDDLPGKHLLTDAVQEPVAEPSVDEQTLEQSAANGRKEPNVTNAATCANGCSWQRSGHSLR